MVKKVDESPLQSLFAALILLTCNGARMAGGSFQVWRVLDVVFGLSAADEKCVHAAASKATAAQLVEGKARLTDA